MPLPYRVAEDGLGRGLADAIDVLEGDLDTLAIGNLDVVNAEILDDKGSAPRSCHLYVGDENEMFTHGMRPPESSLRLMTKRGAFR